MSEEREYKKKTIISDKNPTVNVKIDSEQMQKTLEEKIELERQLEDERTKREDYEAKLTLIAEQKFNEKRKLHNAPDWITEPEQLRDWVENKKTGERVGKGGAGVVGLEGNLGDTSEEFDSHEELVNSLVARKMSGDKDAENTLNALWKKQAEAMKSGDLPNTIYEDDLKDGKSLFRRLMDARNERVRKKVKGERE